MPFMCDGRFVVEHTWITREYLVAENIDNIEVSVAVARGGCGRAY